MSLPSDPATPKSDLDLHLDLDMTPEDHQHSGEEVYSTDTDTATDTETETDTDTRQRRPLHVAIIGGGITGLTLALGLSARGVSYTVYERSPELREIGAGVGLSSNAERALRAVEPRAHAAFKSVAAPGPSGGDWFEWVDGMTDQLAFRLRTRINDDEGEGEAFQGCRRSDLLEALARLVELEGGDVRFGMAVDGVEGWGEEGGERGVSDKVVLRFEDGTVEEADIVIGCDGIHSRVRQVLLGEDNPASYATYTYKFCFRTIIPMTHVEKHPEIAHRMNARVMFNGPGAHIMTYPIGANADVLNVLLVISDPASSSPSPVAHHHQQEQQVKAKKDKKLRATRASKHEAIAAFAAWHPTIRGIVDLLPNDEEMDPEDNEKGALRWNIYDMHEHPAPHYVRGRVCLAGDAAHASTPHLGSGAGFGIEDALALATVLEALDKDILTTATSGHSNDSNNGEEVESAAAGAGKRGVRNGRTDARETDDRARLCRAALAAYNDVRYERTQWLPKASREACALFEWEGEAGRRGKMDPEWFGGEITGRFYHIWKYDVDGMVRDVVCKFRERVGYEGMNERDTT